MRDEGDEDPSSDTGDRGQARRGAGTDSIYVGCWDQGFRDGYRSGEGGAGGAEVGGDDAPIDKGHCCLSLGLSLSK